MKGIEMNKFFLLAMLSIALCETQIQERKVGKLQEVFAWKQMTYDIDGHMLLKDQTDEPGIDGPGWMQHHDRGMGNRHHDWLDNSWHFGSSHSHYWHNAGNMPLSLSDPPKQFFTQYNNVPIGVEKVGSRLFIAVPRRQNGIPSTLNYIDLAKDAHNRSPHLKPFPDFQTSKSLVSIYRTRADTCGRLWAVDTGLIQVPGNPRQVQPPSIVAFDLEKNEQILRHRLKSSDLASASTPGGLISITIDVDPADCGNAFAYVPDLVSYTLIVFSLKSGDSWKIAHSFFHFNPIVSVLNIAGQEFQWTDGIFSLTLAPSKDICKTAYFHPFVGHHEFAVSTCVLRNKTASSDSNFWKKFAIVGDRGEGSQSNMHDFHPGAGVIIYSNPARSGIACWNTRKPLDKDTFVLLEHDEAKLPYISDLHVTGDEVWVITNALPKFIYSRLNTTAYNFVVYKASVHELIAGTPCTA